jgi:hypothetical protein
MIGSLLALSAAIGMRQMRHFCAIMSDQSVKAWISISIPIDSG